MVNRAPTTRAYGRVVLLGVAVAANVLLVAVEPRHGAGSAIAVAVAVAACGALALLEGGDARLGRRLVVGAVMAVMVVAVITPPRTSNDLWSYGAYGRMVVAHDRNPYTATPSEFPNDPIARRVSPIWAHRSSVYGPAWLGVSAVDAALVGPSKVGNRLFFQILAALAASAVLLLVWRRTRSTATILWLGMNPAFLAVAVNGGHADLMIGLAILVAACCASRGAGWIAGIVIGLAALVKVTAILAVVGVILWAWRARRARVAVGTAVGALATMLIGYSPFVGDASRVLTGSDHTVTAASPWNGLADLLLGHDARRTVAHPLAYNPTLETIFWAGLVVVGALVLVLGWRAARSADARPAVGTTTAAYSFGSSYSFPWYLNWSLPSMADAPPSPIAWVVWLQSGAMLLVLKLRVHATGTPGDQIFRVLFTDVVPLVLLLAFVVYGLRAGSEARTPAPAEVLGP